MELTSISYKEIADFYKELGIDTDCDGQTSKSSNPPASWEMPTAFDDVPLVFSNSTTNLLKDLG